jgi:YVTN family beta-propeller protein
VYGRENNGLALGVFVQSMYLYQDKAYVCVDNAGKLNVMDANTFKQLAAISLQQPNSMVADGNTGYVTEWANVTDYNNPPKGNVAFIDLQTNSLITRVTTDGALPRDIRFLNGRLYVINSAENSIAIINVTNRRLERKVITGDSPNSMVFDRNNNLWVLCGSFGGTNAVLIRYSVNGDNLTEQSRFGFSTSDASRLIVNSAGDRLYYNFNGSVFSQSITATSLSTTPFLNRDFMELA